MYGGSTLVNPKYAELFGSDEIFEIWSRKNFGSLFIIATGNNTVSTESTIEQ